MGSLGSNEEKETRFRVRSPLRCDGVGKLDCAEDVESGARMAVRWLPLDANGAAAARALELLPPHPTLPRIRSTGLRGSAAFVAMDFPDGKLLSTLSDEQLDTQALVRMGAEVADALATLHLQGTFHGELSTDSVLLLPERRAVLWDVPLVVANRMTDRRTHERSSYTALRTAPFLAPERARGLPPSAPADVYALGAVLCLAGGSLPPPGVTTLAVVHQIATGQWTPQVPRHFPEPLRDLLERMLSTEPLMRPNATDVAELLGRGLDGMDEREPERTEEVPLQPSRLGLRSKTPFVVVGAVVAGLLGVALATLVGQVGKGRSNVVASPPVAQAAPVEADNSALLAPLVAPVGAPGLEAPTPDLSAAPRGAGTPVEAAVLAPVVAHETLAAHAPARPARVAPAKAASAKASGSKRSVPGKRAAQVRAAAPARSPAPAPRVLPALLTEAEESALPTAAGAEGFASDLKRPSF